MEKKTKYGIKMFFKMIIIFVAYLIMMMLINNILKLEMPMDVMIFIVFAIDTLGIVLEIVLEIIKNK